MLNKLAADIRFMQIYAHNAHNLVKGPAFFQDHEFLGELYPIYEQTYDGIIERMIGLGQKVDVVEIHKIAFLTLENADLDLSNWAGKILQFEKYICLEIEKLIPGQSEGTRQFLGEICNQSEMRQYKLKQRASQ